MTEKQASYKSFMLRMWRDKEAEDCWRITLFPVAESSESRHFVDLDSLFYFLQEEMSSEKKHIIQSDKDN